MIRTRPVLFAAGSALALLALTGCSSGGTDDGSSAAASPTASTEVTGGQDTGQGGVGGPGGDADFTAYRECLAENGVSLPDRGAGGPGDGERPSGMPSGSPPSGMARPSGAPGDGERPSGMPGGPSGGFALPDGVDQETFDAAQQACASLAPQGGPGEAPGNGDAAQ